MNILAVDDSPSIRDLISDILSARGHNVITAKNGADALNKYADHNPDIVLLDLAMPVMNGRETLTKIISDNKNAKVILLSASENDEQIYKYLQSGATAYITKPFKKDELINAIEHPSSVNKKYLNTLFSFITNKIQDTLETMECNATISLSDTTYIQQETPQYSDVSKIRAINEINNDLKISPSKDLGFVTVLENKKGIVLSNVQKEDIKFLLGGKYNPDNVLEFFNIFNQKIISGYANAIKTEFTPQPTTEYHDVKYGNLAFKEIIRVGFEILCENRKIPLETQLCLGEIVTSEIY